MFPSRGLAKLTAHDERFNYDVTTCTFMLVLYNIYIRHWILVIRILPPSVVESLPRVKQHLSTLPFIEQLVRRFSFVKPDDFFDKAYLPTYLAEDILSPDQQVKHEGKDGSNGATSKVNRRVLSIQRSTRHREGVVLVNPDGCYDAERTYEVEGE